MYCNLYCNPSADRLLEAAHDALSGSHLRLALIAWLVGAYTAITASLALG
jgi:hypothetical protein